MAGKILLSVMLGFACILSGCDKGEDTGVFHATEGQMRQRIDAPLMPETKSGEIITWNSSLQDVTDAVDGKYHVEDLDHSVTGYWSALGIYDEQHGLAWVFWYKDRKGPVYSIDCGSFIHEYLPRRYFISREERVMVGDRPDVPVMKYFYLYKNTIASMYCVSGEYYFINLYPRTEETKSRLQL